MLLNDRTRALLSRKIERSQLGKQEVDHAIDINPVVGTNSDISRRRSVGEADKLPGNLTIRRSGDPLTRKLRQRLLTTSQEELQSRQQDKSVSPSSQTGPVIKAGDSVACRAKLRRKRT